MTEPDIACKPCGGKCKCTACHTANCGIDHEPTMKDGDFPNLTNCNQQCPEECFLPYLVGMPGMKGASMALPLQYLRQWSRRLWDGGNRRVEKPVIFYHKPRAGEINPMFAAGEWKDEPPDPNADKDIDISKLSLAMQAELARQVDEKRKAAAPPEPPKVMAKVGKLTRFDPNHHTVREVLTHLRDASESEVARVVKLERNSSQRAGILKRYKNVQPR